MKLSMAAALALAMVFGTVLLPGTGTAGTVTRKVTVAQDDCVVTGSNNVPLRVRSTPNGRIVGKLKIGSHIKAWDLVTDRNGEYWTKIKWGRGFGYVSTQFISCG